jgi:alpha-L-fucosidase
MTINDSWGYIPTDNNWKNAQRIVQNLVECCRDGGNYLLNIGPRADGSVPAPSVQTLQAVGKWLQKNGEAVYGTQICKFPHGNIGAYTRRGNTLYTIIYYWPGETMTVGGARFKVRSAKLLASGKEVSYTQKGSQLIFSGLPKNSPDDSVTIIVVECDSEPIQHGLSSLADPPS